VLSLNRVPFGIGTTSPAALLNVSGGASNAVIRWDSNGHYGIMQQQTDNNFLIQNDGSGDMYLAGNGAVAWSSNSDLRLKHDINPLSSSVLDRILALNPVTFHWKDAKQDTAQGLQIGFIEQEVEGVFPEIVTHSGTTTITLASGEKQTIEKTLGVTQTSLISPLVKSVQELYGQEQATSQAVAVLKAENDRLKARADKAEAESTQLKAFLCGQFPAAPMCHP